MNPQRMIFVMLMACGFSDSSLAYSGKRAFQFVSINARTNLIVSFVKGQWEIWDGRATINHCFWQGTVDDFEQLFERIIQYSGNLEAQQE